jgi:predicted DsbA family dithiol-disulfide isomerase
MTTAIPDVPVPPAGSVHIWSDLLCPFTFVLLNTWSAARAADPGLAAISLVHHCFPLELFNGPHPRRGTDTEAVGLGQVAPAAGFRVWTGPDDLYPHTVLLAAEAVLAATAQSPRAGELLDYALRQAFWGSSRSISHRTVIDEIVRETAELHGDVLDVDELGQALDSGEYRSSATRDYLVSQTDAIPGSPTVVLADEEIVHNPGMDVHWEGPWAAGFPIVDRFDPQAQVDVLRRAVSHQQ